MKNMLLLYIALMAATAARAQTVIQNWATFSSDAFPYALTVDKAGNVYTANPSNSTVSKITSVGTVTQAWATLSSIAVPVSIVTDDAGNVYTANSADNTVSKITSAGAVTQAWATLASDASPISIAIDATGNLYIANNLNNTISKITSAGAVTQAWATLAGNAQVAAIAFDAAGNLYTANNTNLTVSKITSDGVVTQAWATLSTKSTPVAIATDAAGNVFTLNSRNNTVSKITSAGVVTQAWANLASNPTVQSIAIDGAGNQYVTSSGGTVAKITAAGDLTPAWVTFTGRPNPRGIATDGKGNLYTANYSDNTVSKISGAVALPINLLGFTGTSNNDKNILAWTVADAVAFGHFELQRQDGGVGAFNTIQTIPYNSGQGTYQYVDAAVKGDAAYRLKLVDLDGGGSFGPIVYLKRPNSSTFAINGIYPMPATNTLNLLLYAPQATNVYYEVVDMLGRAVQTERHSANGSTTQTINIANLKSGHYILKVKTANGQQAVRQFIKQ